MSAIGMQAEVSCHREVPVVSSTRTLECVGLETFATTSRPLHESCPATKQDQSSADQCKQSLTTDACNFSDERTATTCPTLLSGELGDGDSNEIFMNTSLGLIGRTREVSILRYCFARMINAKSERVNFDSNFRTHASLTSDVHKEVVFIRGSSGIGKSSLAASIKSDVNGHENGFFVEGKFDVMTSNEPYSGVAEALGSICEEVLASPKESMASVRRMISNDLRDEIQTLLPLIPQLRGFITAYSGIEQSKSKESRIRQLSNGQERLKYSFRVLIRALNSAFSPIVLVLDDLQWADVPSLQVIDYLISDRQNYNHFMIIGCYRPEEVLERGILMKCIDDLKQKRDKYSFHLTEMKLNSCHVDNVHKMVMAMMSTDDENYTQDLAEVCYLRTLGNPFFVLQFMSMLQSEAMLSYNSNSMKWIWDINRIERETKHTSNLVDFFKGRMKRMSDEVQRLLQIAACLGTTFSRSAIDITWKEHKYHTLMEITNVSNLLDYVEDEQFLEKRGNSSYKWVHDTVQEAAMSLSDEADSSFKSRIGRTLLSALNEEELEDELFEVVDLINRGNSATRPELAALNLQAAEKAQSLSAYESAATYVKYGAALLPRSHWTSHRHLTLDLYRLGAEMELALGHNREAAGYCNAVFQRHDCTAMEKFPVRMAVITQLCSGELSSKNMALKMCISTLKELGHKFVWSKTLIPMQALIALTKTVKKTKERLKHQHSNSSLGEMKDPKCLAVLQIFSRMTDLCYHTESIYLNALSICHLVNLTLEHGKNDLAAYGIASLGCFAWVVLKDFGTARLCSESALAMQETIDPLNRGKTALVANIFCLSWTRPLDECVLSIENAYRSCLRFSQKRHAMWCLLWSNVLIPYMLGTPLSKLLKDYPKLVFEMEEHYEFETATILKMTCQAFVNITSGNVTSVKGALFDMEADVGQSATIRGMLHFLEGEVLFYSNIDDAAHRAVKHGDKFQKLCPAAALGMLDTFHRGVALYALARNRKNRRYKSKAFKVHKAIKKWIVDLNPNVEHYDLLLDAEHASLRTKTHQAADDYYNMSIASAVKSGRLADCGLCHERYADFLLIRFDKEGAMQHLSEAIRCYEEWGAMGKVYSLKQQLR